MDRITVPEDLKSLSDEELTALGLEIREAAEALADDAASSDEALTEIEHLVTEFDRINAELAAREEKAAQRRERAEAILGHLDEGNAADTDTEVDTFEPESDIEPEIAASTEADDADIADADADAEFDTDDSEETVEAVTEEAEVEELAAEVEAEATTQPTPTTEITEVEIVEDTPTTAQVRRPTVSALRRSRPAAAEPQPTSEVRAAGAALLATNAVAGVGYHEGQSLDVSSLAEAMAAKAHGLNSTSTGVQERIVMATAKAQHEYVLSGGAEENFATLEAVKKSHAAFRGEQQSLVASGGNCAPLEPSYEFFRLAEELNPVEQCLPVAEAPRGGIRFITPPDFRDACAGVRVTTEAEDAAGYPPTAPKPCVSVVCPPVEECRVDAVSQCVEFGNLNFRVFPEQVEAFLSDLGVCFTETKEIFYLDAIDALSTAVTSTPAYGATRGIVQDLAAAAAGYRRRNHMAPDATLQILLPSWVMEFIKVDMVNDHSLGLGFLDADTSAVTAEMLANLNLDPCFYYDSATGAGQAFNDPQVAGPLNPFPSTVVSYLFAPGTFVRLDGGTLDVGLIRDSSLNGTNDLQIFSEQWIQVCRVGLESVRIEHTLCPDGTAPEPVAPLICA